MYTLNTFRHSPWGLKYQSPWTCVLCYFCNRTILDEGSSAVGRRTCTGDWHLKPHGKCRWTSLQSEHQTTFRAVWSISILWDQSELFTNNPNNKSEAGWWGLKYKDFLGHWELVGFFKQTVGQKWNCKNADIVFVVQTLKLQLTFDVLHIILVRDLRK